MPTTSASLRISVYTRHHPLPRVARRALRRIWHAQTCSATPRRPASRWPSHPHRKFPRQIGSPSSEGTWMPRDPSREAHIAGTRYASGGWENPRVESGTRAAAPQNRWPGPCFHAELWVPAPHVQTLCRVPMNDAQFQQHVCSVSTPCTAALCLQILHSVYRPCKVSTNNAHCPQNHALLLPIAHTYCKLCTISTTHAQCSEIMRTKGGEGLLHQEFFARENCAPVYFAQWPEN